MLLQKPSPVAALTVRPFREADVPALLTLMKALARFEGYDEDFRVTPEDLHLMGLGARPAFGALVADRQGQLEGYAAYYTIPFTYRMQPTLVLKELYVSKQARADGTGRQLFEGVARVAAKAGAARIEWLVLPDNHAAKRFYKARGGSQDQAWERWGMAVPAADSEQG